MRDVDIPSAQNNMIENKKRPKKNIIIFSKNL